MTDYEPHDQQGAMPDPDWGRVLVNTAHKKAPSGDPTLWGNSVTTPIDLDPANAVIGGPAFFSTQIIQAQAADRYSRPWSLVGSLRVSQDAWSDDFGKPDFPSQFPRPGFGPRLQVYLSITLGIEKVTFQHTICLMCSGTTPNVGLCNNQTLSNGGPYLPIRDIPISEDFSTETRPFAAIGALVGNTISVRAMFMRNSPGAGGEGSIPDATIALMLAPSAAGAGI